MSDKREDRHMIDDETVKRLGQQAYRVHSETRISPFPNDSHAPKWEAVVRMVASALSEQPRQDEATLKWAVDRWHDEVASRPMVNVHRPALDGTWRQVIRHFGGDDVLLCGPDHYARHALEAAGAVS